MENPQTPARILVVDDEPDIRNILHILLSSRGYAVDEAENGLRAVACVRAQPDYDLIIMDIMMPGMVHGKARLTRRNIPSEDPAKRGCAAARGRLFFLFGISLDSCGYVLCITRIL